MAQNTHNRLGRPPKYGPETGQQVVHLRDVGWTWTKIAETLGMASEASARAVARRAMKSKTPAPATSPGFAESNPGGIGCFLQCTTPPTTEGGL